MRVGLFLAYRSWSTPPEQIELAVRADERRLDALIAVPTGDKRAVVEAPAHVVA